MCAPNRECWAGLQEFYGKATRLNAPDPTRTARTLPITKRFNYLNHAAVSPLPLPTLQAVESQLKDVHDYGSVNFLDWLSTKEDARKLLAQLLGARPEQIAFLRNTSDALSTVANGLTWRRGENVVTFRGEFPSNIYPWLRLRDDSASRSGV